MKPLLFILIIFMLMSCGVSDRQQANVNTSETQSLIQDPSELYGLWAMVDYVDSVLEYKTISTYHLLGPSWIAILIDMNKNTIRTHGSIYDLIIPFKPKGDTLCVFEKVTNTQWALILNPVTKNVELRSMNSEKGKNDPRVYEFHKRPDLNFLLDTLDNVHETRTSFTQLFNDSLFSGTYVTLGKNDLITFGPQGQMKGFQDFSKYKVDVFFGTLNYYNNMDNITFYRDLPDDSEAFSWESYHWQFKGDTLLLKPFYWKLFEHDGRKVRGEFPILSDQEMRMVKQ